VIFKNLSEIPGVGDPEELVWLTRRGDQIVPVGEDEARLAHVHLPDGRCVVRAVSGPAGHFGYLVMTRELLEHFKMHLQAGGFPTF
jgi:hypothetical protein